MSFDQSSMDNHDLLQDKIYKEEENLYNEKMLKFKSEDGLNCDSESLFPHHKKNASDFVSNVAYKCLALDIANIQSSNLVLLDPADAIDLFLKENFDINFAEAKVLSDGQKKYILLENIEHKAWLLHKEGFFKRQINSCIHVRVIFQELEKKFSTAS